MYARSVGGEELSFGVSGMLWRDNLIMYDRQTDSWWSQADGRAIRGPKQGAGLEHVPSDMMRWTEWRAIHPGTLVLSTGETRRGRDAYASYHAGRNIGVTGRTRRSGGGLDAKARVLGFRLGPQAFVVPLDALSKTPVLQVDAGGESVVLVATPDRSTARVFLGGSAVFEDAGVTEGRVRMRDRATGSVWDGFEGRAVSGPRAGETLQAVTSHLSYWFSWYSFFPDTTVLGISRPAPEDQ